MCLAHHKASICTVRIEHLLNEHFVNEHSVNEHSVNDESHLLWISPLFWLLGLWRLVW